MRRKSLQWYGVLIAIVFSGAGPGYAAEIFSTFGPGAGYTTAMYMPVNFYTSPEAIGTHLAFAFTVPSNAEYTLNAVQLAASWAGTKENAQFSIYADVGGIPGDAALEILATNPNGLHQYPDITVVSLAAPTQLTLQHSAQYWFTVAPASLDTTSPANDFVELWLNPDAAIRQTSRNWYGADPWGAWYEPPFEGTAPAFRVLASPVPLPVPMLLMLAPLGISFFRRGKLVRRHI